MLDADVMASPIEMNPVRRVVEQAFLALPSRMAVITELETKGLSIANAA